MCMLEFQYHDPDPQQTPEQLGFGIISYKFETSRNSLSVPILGLVLPEAVPSLAVFAWKTWELLAGNATCSCLRHHVVWAITANFFPFSAYLQAKLVSNGPPFSHGTSSWELFGWKWREYRRNSGKYARFGNCLGGQVECHFVDFL